MTPSEAATLIRDAIPSRAGTWADLGAGDGTFTRALAQLLESGSRIYAVDRDGRALGKIARWAGSSSLDVVTVVADITAPFDLPGLGDALLDGMLLANTLHFVEAADAVLARLTRMLRPGGRVVLVEYDRRRADRWVPFPIPPERLHALAAGAGLAPAVVIAKTPSAFGGDVYAAVADKARAGA